MGQPLFTEIGDAEAMLAASPHKVDRVYRTPRHNHNAIEPHAATIMWNGDELTIHDTTQMVTAQAATIADIFDLKAEQVRVISPYVGGGFGCKGLADHQILAAAAARLIGRPVRVTLSREGVYRIVGGRTLTEQRVAIGAAADGHFTALIHTGALAMTAHNNMPEPFITVSRSSYAADSFKLSVETVTMNMLANIFMRAPGESVGSFALESAIDELAIELGMDPIELRIRNEPDKDPTSGLPFSSRHIVEAWRSGAERFGWERRSAVPGKQREGEWLVGMGCATATYPYLRMPGAAARITLDARRYGSRRGGRARDGHGYRDDNRDGRGRSARAATRSGRGPLRRFDHSGRFSPGIAADRRDRRCGDRRASRACRRTAQAGGQ
jgi:xanthine dehydrogenase YagR molybdenum-binding subunit